MDQPAVPRVRARRGLPACVEMPRCRGAAPERERAHLGGSEWVGVRACVPVCLTPFCCGEVAGREGGVRL